MRLNKDYDKNLSRHSLEHLIREGEHVQQDFKYKISDSRKIARTLSAFSNTHGGRILIGVKDNGQIAGVKDEDDIYMIESASQLFLHPSIDVTVEAHHISGKVIWEISVAEGKKKPYMVEEKEGMVAYYRDRDENFEANSVLIEIWRQEQASNSKRPVEFSDNERKLIDYLKVYPNVSVSKASKIMGLRRWTAVETIARLIRWKVLNWYQEKGKFYYFLD
jgi:predicted HTH transcriptional regulator